MAPRADGTSDPHIHHHADCEGDCDGACDQHDHGHNTASGGALDGSDGEKTYVTDHTALLAYMDEGWDHLRWNAPHAVGTAIVVTYSFDHVSDIHSSNPYGASAYWAFDAHQQEQFRAVTEVFSAVTGVQFAEITGEAMVNVFGADGTGVGGWADYAVSSKYSTGSGELVSAYRDMDPGDYGFQVLLHELGHSLGLSHPFEHEDRTLDPSMDNQEHTIMTYNSTNPYATGLGTLDIDALHEIYGDSSTQADWRVYTSASNQVIIKGTIGDDKIIATGNETRIDGFAGNDHIEGREANDLLYGFSGSDTLYGRQGEDTIKAGSGADTVYGDNPETFNLGDDDYLFGNRGDDVVYGQRGDDIIYGQNGHDTLYGGYENDTLYGGNGNDVLEGEYGDDDVRGHAGHDTINGNDGDDYLMGHAGRDVLIGSFGNDILNGGDDADVLKGDNGTDKLYGGIGNDLLEGGFGEDFLKGNDGNDTLDGGDGADVMIGGAGADTFLFAYNDAFETNSVMDFEDGTDVIRIIELGLNYNNITLSAGDDAGDSVVSYSNWFRVELTGVTLAELDSSDFLFV